MVDLPLRMVGSNMTEITGLRFAGLLQAELMADMAALTASDRTISRWSTNVVAAFTGKAGNFGSFHFSQNVAGFIGREGSFGYGLVRGEQFGGETLAAGDGNISGQTVPALVILGDL